MKRWAALAAVALAAVALAAFALATRTGTEPAGPVRADAAVVLSGDVDYLRVKHAAALVREGRVGALLLTGHGVGGDSAQEMRKEALAAGVRTDAIVLETASVSTRENLAFAAPIIAEHHWRRMALVTSQSHLARAMATARHTMPGVEWVAAPVPDAGSPSRARRLRAEEALKLLWYRLRGWA